MPDFKPVRRIGKNGQICVGCDLGQRVVVVERRNDGVFLRFVGVAKEKPRPRTPMPYDAFLLRLPLMAPPHEYIGAHGIMKDVVAKKYEEYVAACQRGDPVPIDGPETR